MKRWQTLDVLKGLGLLAMTAAHSLAWWFIYPTTRLKEGGGDWFGPLFIVCGLVVMFLVFSAGYSLYFAWQSNLSSARGSLSDRGGMLARRVVLRSSVLFVVATGVNLLVWGLEAAWYWNILHFIALVQIVLYGLLWLGGIRAVYLAGALSLVISAVPSLVTSWGITGMLNEVLFGNLQSPHIWPLAPWLSVPVFGFILAYHRDILLRWENLRYSFVASTIVFSFTIIFGILTLPIGRSFEYIWDYATFPPTIFIISAAALYTMILSALELWPGGNSVRYVLSGLGQQVTLIYISQLVIGFWYFVQMVPRTEDSLHFFWLGLAIQLFFFVAIVVVRQSQINLLSARRLKK